MYVSIWSKNADLSFPLGLRFARRTRPEIEPASFVKETQTVIKLDKYCKRVNTTKQDEPKTSQLHYFPLRSICLSVSFFSSPASS